MALATDTTPGEIILAGDLHGSSDAHAPELTPSGVQAGTYLLPNIVVDAKGRIIYCENGELEMPCASDTVPGGVKPGRHIVFDENLHKISLPNASPTTFGVVELGPGFVNDDTSIAIDFDIATASTKGLVKVPAGAGLSVDVNGVLSTVLATESVPGVMQVGAGLDVTAGVVSVPDATTSSKGIMQVGAGLSVTSGVVAVSIPPATESTKGVMQVGVGLDVDVNGVVSVDTIGLSQPDASASVKGLVQIGTNINVSSGVISVPDASGTSVSGVVRSNNSANISIVSGVCDVGTNIPKLNSSNTYTSSLISSLTTVASSPTSVTVDASLGNVFKIVLTGNCVIENMTNVVAGQHIVIILQQDGTGGHAPTFGSYYKFTGTQTVTSTANAIDILSVVCLSSTEFLCQLTNDYK